MNEGRREEGSINVIGETFLFPSANEILPLDIYTIVARRDRPEMIPDMIYARAYTRHVTRDNRAPFFFNSTAIMQSLLKTITIAWEGKNTRGQAD